MFGRRNGRRFMSSRFLTFYNLGRIIKNVSFVNASRYSKRYTDKCSQFCVVIAHFPRFADEGRIVRRWLRRWKKDKQ